MHQLMIIVSRGAVEEGGIWWDKLNSQFIITTILDLHGSVGGWSLFRFQISTETMISILLEFQITEDQQL